MTDACYQRHTHAEFLDFLKLVAKAYPRVRLLRAVHANGDFPYYWAHHVREEQRRVHENRYSNTTIPRAA